MTVACETRGWPGAIAGAIVVAFTGLSAACIVVKVDTTETLTDVSLSDILTDGFTLTSSPSVPTGTDVTDTGPDTDTDTDTDTGPPAFCGDGNVDPGEACDDGDPDNGDGCLQTCELAACGDGFLRDGVEACDDGNQVGGDGCEANCTTAECGDGAVQPPEACDDGNGSNTDACLGTCITATCGDGFVRDGVEACDDGNVSNTDACVGSCVAATCGDGFVQAGVELCDDGNATPGDGCTNCLPEGLPPECQTATVLQEGSRNVNSADDVECDLDIPDAGQWSRFAGAAGTKMPTSAPPTFTCGTHAPGWLNGAVPAEADGIVTRDVCFHWEGNTCNWKIPISVLNCGVFVAFKLMPVPTCALRYCGSD